MLSREESTLVTRRRLVRAAMELLAEHGYERLTTGRVAARAGVAQPTFYVHFRDLDQLLETVARELVDELRASLREARAALRPESEPLPLARQTYRLALRAITGDRGRLLRLFAAELYRPSAIGEAARAMVADVAREMAQDVAASGVPTGLSKKELARVAEAMVVLTLHFGVKVVDGDERGIEPLVEVLSRMTVGMMALGR